MKHSTNIFRARLTRKGAKRSGTLPKGRHYPIFEKGLDGWSRRQWLQAKRLRNDVNHWQLQIA